MAGHVEGESALALGVEHYDVHYGDREHVLIHGEAEGVGGGGDGSVEEISIWGEEAVGRYCGVGLGVFEGEGGGELAVYSAWEAHSVYLSELSFHYWGRTYPAAPGFWESDEDHRLGREVLEGGRRVEALRTCRTRRAFIVNLPGGVEMFPTLGRQTIEKRSWEGVRPS